jgi:hypothetical protein
LVGICLALQSPHQARSFTPLLLLACRELWRSEVTGTILGLASASSSSSDRKDRNVRQLQRRLLKASGTAMRTAVTKAAGQTATTASRSQNGHNPRAETETPHCRSRVRTHRSSVVPCDRATTIRQLNACIDACARAAVRASIKPFQLLQQTQTQTTVLLQHDTQHMLPLAHSWCCARTGQVTPPFQFCTNEDKAVYF